MAGQIEDILAVVGQHTLKRGGVLPIFFQRCHLAQGEVVERVGGEHAFQFRQGPIGLPGAPQRQAGARRASDAPGLGVAANRDALGAPVAAYGP